MRKKKKKRGTNLGNPEVAAQRVLELDEINLQQRFSRANGIVDYTLEVEGSSNTIGLPDADANTDASDSW